MNQGKRVSLSASSFSVGYDNTVALTVPKLHLTGGVIALAGHNGAGKSTFLKALLGLLPPVSGTLEAKDPITGETLIPEKHMAFCPETGSVFTDISVKEYLRLWCRLKCNSGKYLFEEGKELLELLELEPLLNKRGRELSKGQCQRVQIAAGFFSRPSLFLFDEPFDGLDVQRTHELMQIIRQHRPSTSFIVSSHRMDVVERLADQVIVLQEGSVKTAGPTPLVCKELCGTMYRIEHASAPRQLREQLQGAFPKAFVYLTGDTIRFIADRMAADKLTSFVREIDRNGASMSEVQPTLTDAMNFHLRKLKHG